MFKEVGLILAGAFIGAIGGFVVAVCIGIHSTTNYN
jgi:hypothetical protein